MSDLSKIKNEVESFFSHFFTQLPPEAQPAAQAAASSVHDAISDAESAAVNTAETVAVSAVPTLESAISKVVPAEFAPLASLVMQLGVAELTSRAQASSSAT